PAHRLSTSARSRRAPRAECSAHGHARPPRRARAGGVGRADPSSRRAHLAPDAGGDPRHRSAQLALRQPAPPLRVFREATSSAPDVRARGATEAACMSTITEYSIAEVAATLDLEQNELGLYGRDAAKISLAALDRL